MPDTPDQTPAPKARKRTRAAGGAAPRQPTPARVAEPEHTDQPTIEELKEIIMATAKTTDYTKLFTDASGKFQEQFKTAYDKSNALSSELVELAKGNVEALVESGKVLASGVQEMGKEAVEQSKTAYETATADFKALAAVKSPTDFFQLQGEFARRNFDAMMGYGTKSSEKAMKLANDAFAPISSRMSVAAEKLTKVA